MLWSYSAFVAGQGGPANALPSERHAGGHRGHCKVARATHPVRVPVPLPLQTLVVSAFIHVGTHIPTLKGAQPQETAANPGFDFLFLLPPPPHYLPPPSSLYARSEQDRALSTTLPFHAPPSELRFEDRGRRTRVDRTFDGPAHLAIIPSAFDGILQPPSFREF